MNGDNPRGFSLRLEKLIDGNVAGLAKRLGMPPQTVFNYARGRSPSWAFLLALHQRMGVSIDWLIDGNGLPFVDTDRDLSKEEAIAALSDLRQRILGDILANGEKAAFLSRHKEVMEITVREVYDFLVEIIRGTSSPDTIPIPFDPELRELVLWAVNSMVVKEVLLYIKEKDLRPLANKYLGELTIDTDTHALRTFELEEEIAAAKRKSMKKSANVKPPASKAG